MKIYSWLLHNKTLFFFILIGVFLRLYKIDFQSVWLDEIHTLNESNPKLSFSEVYDTLLIAEPHPPLYFFIMNVVFKIFGYSTFVARMVSALIGIAGLYAIYLLGKELFSKKVGIYAMILLSVNYFHIYYSQDVRMYGLLFLTTTLSFYYLTRLIKIPTLKNTLIFGLVSTLMIYSHFFAIFTLFAQYIILLYYIIFPFNTTRVKFFKYSLISGGMTILLYIPTYKLILKTTEIKSIWIQMPGLDVYTQFFKDFFGQSEMVLFFIIPIILFYFIKLFSENQNQKNIIDPIEDKNIFSFMILFIWVLVTMIIPLIRTYTSLPMLINRYFINILPAVLIMISIGLSMINNKIVKYGMISILFIFSLSDIFIVKKYYSNITKSQFREVTNFITSNNPKNHELVSKLAWYLPFFIKDEKNKPTVTERSLEEYLKQMIQNPQNIKSFWYFDAHNNPYKLEENLQNFVDSTFVVNDNYDGFDAWTKHFVLEKDSDLKFEVKQYLPLKTQNGDLTKVWIESFEHEANNYKISGWGFLENVESNNNRICIVLINNLETNVVKCEQLIRADITKSENKNINYDNSGFTANILIDKLKKGDYKIGVLIENKKENKKGLYLSDKKIIIN